MQERVPGTSDPIFSLLVNGQARALHAPPLSSLAETLRDRLGLTGTKLGCEAGDCGACTVLMDSEAVCACLVSTAQAAGTRIETVEGADPAGLMENLRRSFLEHGAAQCGACTPGMLMAAAALLSRRPQPTRNDVEVAIGGVLCRCTGYLKIIEAVMAACGGTSVEHSVAPEQGAAVGARMVRVDGAGRVDGSEVFGADRAPDDALWLRVIRSPHASATFALGDLEAFRARHPGLAAVLTCKDIPGENSFGIFADTKDQPVLAEGLVRFRGEAVLALVGGRDEIAAIDAASLPIEWTLTPAIHGVAAALTAARPLHARCSDNVLTRGHLECGDVAEGHARAAATSEGVFETASVEHAYIETEAGYAVPLGEGPERIEIRACTQAPYMDRDEVARVLGIRPDCVRIIPTACGGGFGGKLDVSIQPLLAVAAWRLKRPVCMVYSRMESMVSTTKRHPSSIRAKASADADGRLCAFEMTGDFNTGAYASWGPTVANRVPVHAAGPYKLANAHHRTRAIYTNDTPAGAFRGFGVPQAAIAHETLMDDLAERLGMDRWQIRRINALAAGDATVTGHVLTHSAGLPQCLDAIREDWDTALARADQHNRRNHRVRRGAGIACMWYGCGNTSLSNPSTMRIVLQGDGTLILYNGAVDIGQGSSTVLLQICADALGLPVTDIGMVVGDTALTADAGKTSASRQTLVSGNAVRLAAADLRARMLALANAGPHARLSLNGAVLCIEDGEASRIVELAGLPALAAGSPVVLQGTASYDPPTVPLDANGQGVPYAAYGFAAQIAEVEVDRELATTKVVAVTAAHDVGRAINPTLIEGQIHGGIAQGLGMALMEEFIAGRTENLHDYLIPTAGDMPPIKIHLIEDPEPEGPFGAKGVGEPALVATAPAILSAIRHATGVTIRQIPVLPHRLWQALRQQQEASS